MASDVNKPSKKKDSSEFQQEYLCDSCQLCTSDPFWKNLKFEHVDIYKRTQSRRSYWDVA